MTSQAGLNICSNKIFAFSNCEILYPINKNIHAPIVSILINLDNRSIYVILYIGVEVSQFFSLLYYRDGNGAICHRYIRDRVVLS